MSWTGLQEWVRSKLAAGTKRRRAVPRRGAVPVAPGLRASVRPGLETLEDRLLLSATGPTINVYMPGSQGDDHSYVVASQAGVGFQNDVVAVVAGAANGSADLNPGDYTAQVNYNDGNGWQQATVATEQGANNSTLLVVKGSDVFGANQAGWHAIDVQVNFQGVSTSQTQTAWAAVSNPAGGFAGTQPPPAAPPTSTGAAENVVFGVAAPGTLGDTNSASLKAYTGVALQNSNVGVVEGYVNGVLDNNASDFQAWINWGDGSGWQQAQVVPNTGSSTTPFLVQGSHTYGQTGTFQTTVYAVGPDGSSETNATAVVTVTANPNPAPPIVAVNPASQTVTSGQTATFTASANGVPPPTVQWQVSTDGGNTWTAINGATGTTLTVSNVTTAMSGSQYEAVFTNSNGSATTSAATLTVSPLALSIGSGTLPGGTVGTVYNLSIHASLVAASSGSSGSGGTGSGGVNVSVTPTVTSGSLPAGLAFTTSNGTVTISGTPTSPGTVSFQVTATDSAGDPTLTQTYTLAVNPSAAAAASTPSTGSTSTGSSSSSTGSSSSGSGGSSSGGGTSSLFPGLATSTAFNSTQVAQDAATILLALQTNNMLLLSQTEQNFESLLAPLSSTTQTLALEAFFVDFYNDLG